MQRAAVAPLYGRAAKRPLVSHAAERSGEARREEALGVLGSRSDGELTAEHQAGTAGTCRASLARAPSSGRRRSALPGRRPDPSGAGRCHCRLGRSAVRPGDDGSQRRPAPHIRGRAPSRPLHTRSARGASRARRWLSTWLSASPVCFDGGDPCTCTPGAHDGAYTPSRHGQDDSTVGQAVVWSEPPYPCRASGRPGALVKRKRDRPELASRLIPESALPYGLGLL